MLSVLLCSEHLEKQHSEMREEMAHTKSSVRIMKVSCAFIATVLLTLH